MRRGQFLAVGLLVAVGVLATGCHQGEVQLYATRSQQEQVWMQKLDPDIFKTHEKEVGLTFKISAAGGLASVTPGVSFVNRSKAEWNGQTQALLAKYTLLINDHNTAHISLEEYWIRRAELDDEFVRMATAKPAVEYSMNQVLEYWQKKADKAFADLDKELGKRAAAQADEGAKEVNEEIDRLKARLKALERK